jgi:hypothetical protein
MWTYGAYFRCEEEESSSHGTYDSGVALDETETSANGIDVGTLRKIFMVPFGTFTTVVMKISWIKNIDQGRHTIKEDSSGFWTLLFSAREEPGRRNPFLFPTNATQVFFMLDQQDPNWRCVIRHEPRGRRILGVNDQVSFGIAGTDVGLEGAMLTIALRPTPGHEAPAEVAFAAVQVIDTVMGEAVT